MIVRWLVVAVVGVLFVGGGLRAASRNEANSASGDQAPALVEASAPHIDEVVFIGLRHITTEAVEAQVSSHAGARLDLNKVASDVKVLGRLGWFGEIGVETQPAKDPSPLGSGDTTQRVRLVFRVTELPYLTKVEYAGSRLLSRAQIEKILG
jgi:outer membrane protein assembly factor BamA